MPEQENALMGNNNQMQKKDRRRMLPAACFSCYEDGQRLPFSYQHGIIDHVICTRPQQNGMNVVCALFQRRLPHESKIHFQKHQCGFAMPDAFDKPAPCQGAGG